MLLYLSFLALVCITIILHGVEKRLWGTVLTPFALLAFPLLAVTGCATLLAEPLNFRPVYPEALAISVVGLLIFWLGGLVAYAIVRRLPMLNERRQESITLDRTSRKVLLVASWVLIIVLTYALVKFSIAIVGRPTAVLSEEFQEAYGAGLYGYARAVMMFLFIILVGEVRGRDFLAYLTMAVILLLLVSTMVKGTVMLPLIGGLLYRLYTGRATLTWKGVGKISALLVLLFFLPYVIGLLLVKPDWAYMQESLLQVSRNFFLYLFSGILALGDALRVNIQVTTSDQLTIFAPWLNLFNNLTHAGFESIRPVTQYESMIDLNGIATHPSNVHTLFGTLYLFLGPLWSALYAFLLGLVCYVVLFLQSRSTCWMRGLVALIFAALLFGWFEYYYWHTLFFIPAAFVAVVYVWEFLVRLPLGPQQLLAAKLSEKYLADF